LQLDLRFKNDPHLSHAKNKSFGQAGKRLMDGYYGSNQPVLALNKIAKVSSDEVGVCRDVCWYLEFTQWIGLIGCISKIKSLKAKNSWLNLYMRDH
jgi:hypothetical protein